MHDVNEVASTLPVLDIPFVFSQVSLLSSQQFIDEARSKWDKRVSMADLQELHGLGLLVPLYRADDEPEVEFIAKPHPSDQSRIARYARDGRIRDPQSESFTLWPHLRPKVAGEDWWNGYFYSEWQLLGLRDAFRARENMRVSPDIAGEREYAARVRQEHLTLAALSARFFPSIVGRTRYGDGADRGTVGSARHEYGADARLRAAGFAVERLPSVAEFLLSRAHTSDPMRLWWDLLRHSDASGWFQLRGGALEAVWQRIAAEVLLRAYEELETECELNPLPVAAGAQVWHPLHERVGSQPESDGIHRSLTKLGLSPEPAVVLVLEGETEMMQVPALLDLLGVSGPQQVRVINQRTSSDRPSQLARYIAPRLGRVRGDSFLIESGPTALVIAMDAEGPIWGTQEARARHLRELREIVRQEVIHQGGDLTEGELEVLVQLKTWGESKYELANFTDEELEAALTSVLSRSHDAASASATWSARLRSDIEYVRQRNLDIKVVFDRINQRVSKVQLAEELLPALIAKLEHDRKPPHSHPPVVELVYAVLALVNRLAGGAYRLETPAIAPAS